jgi:hypothetical protein
MRRRKYYTILALLTITISTLQTIGYSFETTNALALTPTTLECVLHQEQTIVSDMKIKGRLEVDIVPKFNIERVDPINPKEKFVNGNYIKEIIWDNATKYNFDPNYLLGICLIETGGTLNPNTTGPLTYCGRAKGICQLMPELIKDYDVEDPYDPYDSIRAATQHLNDLRKLYKDKTIYDENGDVVDTNTVAIIAYNWGQGNVSRMLNRYGHISRGLLPYETRRYLKLMKYHLDGDTEKFNKII